MPRTTTRGGISKSVTLDYTSPLKNILTETEAGGLTYRHVYGLQEVSVNVGSEKLYVHLDRLGSTRLLTDELGALRSGTQYDAWGVATVTEPLIIGGDEVDLGVSYTGHSYKSEREVMTLPNSETYLLEAAIMTSIRFPLSTIILIRDCRRQ